MIHEASYQVLDMMGSKTDMVYPSVSLQSYNCVSNSCEVG